ncbi:MAG: Rrf2 family transcriptional regulator [Clostridiales bacterium]|jgi:Rrf2 family protein|nr:Rrf2 family transcriptional regulator [Clostridiales bacterium]
MKISTKGRYGLRVVVDLALYSKSGYTSSGNIAERQGISVKYLEQVLNVLKKTGIVKSVKGARGGYMLACDCATTTVSDVLRVLEGNLSVVDSSEHENTTEDLMGRFLDKHVWSEIDRVINDTVDSITIEDLVREYKRMIESTSLIYHI